MAHVQDTALIEDAVRAMLALDPVKRQLLAALARTGLGREPAKRLEMPRQQAGLSPAGAGGGRPGAAGRRTPAARFRRAGAGGRGRGLRARSGYAGGRIKPPTRRIATPPTHLVQAASTVVREVTRMRGAAEAPGHGCSRSPSKPMSASYSPRTLRIFPPRWRNPSPTLADAICAGRGSPRLSPDHRARILRLPASASQTRQLRSRSMSETPQAGRGRHHHRCARSRRVWAALRDPAQIEQWFGWDAPSLAEEIKFIFVDDATGDEASARHCSSASGRAASEAIELTTVWWRHAPAAGSVGRRADRLDRRLRGHQPGLDQLLPAAAAGARAASGRGPAHHLSFRPQPARHRRAVGGAGARRSDRPGTGSAYAATLGTGDSASGKVWYQTHFQTALTVEQWGNGLLVVTDMGVSPKRPHGGGSVLLTTYGLVRCRFRRARATLDRLVDRALPEARRLSICSRRW